MKLINLLSEVASNSTANTTASDWQRYGIFIMLFVIIAFWIFLSYRQNKKRKEELDKRFSTLKVGARVKTIGGILGTIVAMDDENNTITLSTGLAGQESYITIDKDGIYQFDLPEEIAQNDGVESEEHVDNVDNGSDDTDAQ